MTLGSELNNMAYYGKSYISDISLFEPLTTKDFSLTTNFISDDATKKSSDFWRLNRRDSLDLMELKTYAILDSIGEKKNYELNKVVDELENKNQDLEQFAHVAAHDIKSPISNISNLAGMFLASYKSQLNDDGLGLIELIIKSSDQLYKFLERLMDYSANIDTVGEEKNYISLKNFSEKVSNFYSSDQNLELNFNSEIKNLNTNDT